MCDYTFCVNFHSEPTHSCCKDVHFETIPQEDKLVPNYVVFQMEHLVRWGLPQPEHQDSPDPRSTEGGVIFVVAL